MACFGWHRGSFDSFADLFGLFLASNLPIPNSLQNFLDILSTSVVKYALQNDHDRSVEHATAARHQLFPFLRPATFDFQLPTVDFLG